MLQRTCNNNNNNLKKTPVLCQVLPVHFILLNLYGKPEKVDVITLFNISEKRRLTVIPNLAQVRPLVNIKASTLPKSDLNAQS